MALTAAEQYLLELMNRARLDPAAEAARFGIGLNDGLAAGTITAASKQVLAPNALLELAAINHSLWMIENDTISHTGANGSTYVDRINATGYNSVWRGEDIAWTGRSVPINLADQIDSQYAGLFKSATHRAVMLETVAREVGIGQEGGIVRMNRVDFHSSVITVDFGSPGTTKFVTGVAYNDTDRNAFYSMGEGVAGVSLAALGESTVTASAGGYALSIDAASATKAIAVSGKVGLTAFSALLDMTIGNVKLDIVNGSELMSSGSITLVSGLNAVTLQGLNRLSATGNGLSNTLTGNKGDNLLDGAGGNDWLAGSFGNDTIVGGAGNDTLVGGAGRDVLVGTEGLDILIGGSGLDRFVFRNGSETDRVADFAVGTDRLNIWHQNWTGTLSAEQVVARFAHVVTGGVRFDFDATDHLLLVGLTTTDGLAASIDII